MSVKIYSNLVKSWTHKNEIYLNNYLHEIMKWTENVMWRSHAAISFTFILALLRSSGGLPSVYPSSCQICAKDFAPGQESFSPGGAKDFNPGQEAKVKGDAKDFAPGELKK